MSKHILLKELAKKLDSKGGGNCKDDPDCIYGVGVKRCSASEEIINEKYAAYEAEARKLEGPAMFQYNDKAPWPCATFQTIVIGEPPG